MKDAMRDALRQIEATVYGRVDGCQIVIAKSREHERCGEIARAALALPDWLEIPTEIDTTKPPFDGARILGCVLGFIPLVAHWSNKHRWWRSDPDDMPYNPTHYQLLPAAPEPTDG